MITLRYVWHDCFIVTTPEFSVVFDYFPDPLRNPAPPAGEMPWFLSAADPAKPLYVFVSHHHKDHFSRDIFNWAHRFPKTRYILSDDTARMCRHVFSATSVYRGDKVDPARLTVLRPGDVYADQLLEVRAFGSTDIGNSYVVSTGRRRIYHAGDLNAWLWLDESTPEEVEEATQNYLRILATIADAYDGPDTRLDIAMHPVDPRMGRGFEEGARILMRRFDVRHFVPMHFCLAPDEAEMRRYALAAADFPLYANPRRGACVALLQPGSTLTIPR